MPEEKATKATIEKRREAVRGGRKTKTNTKNSK